MFKVYFSQLSPYLPTWVRVCLGLRYCSCSLLSPSCFRSLHSLTSYLFPLALSPSLRFDVGALRALTAKLLFPSWLLPDGVLLGGGRGLWCAIGKLEVEGWHCLCGPVHTPAEGSISQIRSLPSVHVSLYMNRVTTARAGRMLTCVKRIARQHNMAESVWAVSREIWDQPDISWSARRHGQHPLSEPR